MDIECFLKSRTEFTRYFYEKAVCPFMKIKTAIENEKEPFVPPYTEDAEPYFLEEWMKADTAIIHIGYACVSMLSSSLKLFFEEWSDRLEKDTGIKNYIAISKKKGWLYSYKQFFEKRGFPLSASGADLDVIEQTILARNRVQHPEEITMLGVYHSKEDLKKFPNPFFAKEVEIKMTNPTDDVNTTWWLKPSVALTREQVFEAVKQVEVVCSWLEEEYWKWRKSKT